MMMDSNGFSPPTEMGCGGTEKQILPKSGRNGNDSSLIGKKIRLESSLFER